MDGEEECRCESYYCNISRLQSQQQQTTTSNRPTASSLLKLSPFMSSSSSSSLFAAPGPATSSTNSSTTRRKKTTRITTAMISLQPRYSSSSCHVVTPPPESGVAVGAASAGHRGRRKRTAYSMMVNRRISTSVRNSEKDVRAVGDVGAYAADSIIMLADGDSTENKGGASTLPMDYYNDTAVTKKNHGKSTTEHQPATTNITTSSSRAGPFGVDCYRSPPLLPLAPRGRSSSSASSSSLSSCFSPGCEEQQLIAERLGHNSPPHSPPRSAVLNHRHHSTAGTGAAAVMAFESLVLRSPIQQQQRRSTTCSTGGWPSCTSSIPSAPCPSPFNSGTNDNFQGTVPPLSPDRGCGQDANKNDPVKDEMSQTSSAPIIMSNQASSDPLTYLPPPPKPKNKEANDILGMVIVGKSQETYDPSNRRQRCVVNFGSNKAFGEANDALVPSRHITSTPEDSCSFTTPPRAINTQSSQQQVIVPENSINDDRLLRLPRFPSPSDLVVGKSDEVDDDVDDQHKKKKKAGVALPSSFLFAPLPLGFDDDDYHHHGEEKEEASARVVQFASSRTGASFFDISTTSKSIMTATTTTATAPNSEALLSLDHRSSLRLGNRRPKPHISNQQKPFPQRQRRPSLDIVAPSIQPSLPAQESYRTNLQQDEEKESTTHQANNYCIKFPSSSRSNSRSPSDEGFLVRDPPSGPRPCSESLLFPPSTSSIWSRPLEALLEEDENKDDDDDGANSSLSDSNDEDEDDNVGFVLTTPIIIEQEKQQTQMEDLVRGGGGCKHRRLLFPAER